MTTDRPRTLADLEPPRWPMYVGGSLVVLALVVGAWGLGYTANVERWTEAEHEWGRAQQMAEACLSAESRVIGGAGRSLVAVRSGQEAMASFLSRHPLPEMDVVASNPLEGR